MRRQASWPACRDLITEARLLKHIDSKMQIFCHSNDSYYLLVEIGEMF